MPYAFVHIAFAWLCAVSARFFGKFRISRIEWFLLFFGAVLPDVDYLFEWTFGSSSHRLFTHSLLMLAASFILCYLVFRILKEFRVGSKNPLRCALFLAGGVFTHLLADFVFSPYAGIPLFWPSLDFYGLLSGVKSYSQVLAVDYMNLETIFFKFRIAIFDMGVGVAWLFYLIYSGKIKDF